MGNGYTRFFPLEGFRCKYHLIPGLNTFLPLVLSVYLRPLKLNNGFPVTRFCYGLKMAETLIIFIQILIISI